MKNGNPLLPILGELNVKFSQHLTSLVGKSPDFAPGKSLPKALADLVTHHGTPLHSAYESYLKEFPGSIQEAVRSIIYYALSTTPPTMITWAWQASYDFELDTWEVVEPAPQMSGITLLIKSRYPDDKHPNI